ncbi:DedA family protein [Bacillus toyonensis]|uniref:Alkaline phosphatase n=1 Tax=Bacillus toyonensis TaxID=155322 RepID=A0A2C4PU40_9BACI|nr:DedA family protein [Bacillus toyonensis]PHD55780.1 alkaline phosphatase [Bacillus toyonensis]
MEHQLTYLIEHFGYFGVILALIGGIIGIPIPDEVLLTYVGYNVFQGKMSYMLSLLSAFTGAIGGISLSYILGIKLGLPFLKKFGPKVHITEEKINRTKKLLMKLGPYLLFIGYFIPGVRHVTAYLAGINCYSFKKFALYAYSGAIFWCFTFVTLGRELGENWNKVETYISKYSIYLILIVVLGFIIVYIYWKKRTIKNV